MQVAYSASNKIGKFNITWEQLNDREIMASLFALLDAVLHCYDHESGRGKTYIAASDKLFQQVEEGGEVPQYRLEFDHPLKPLPDREAAAQCVKSKHGFSWRAVRNHIVRVPPLNIHMQPRLPQ